MPEWPRTRIPEWIAWLGVLAAAVAHGLMRIPCDDINSHLATARHAFQNGFWPVVNTFSYTHADFPLYCQYGGFEALAYLVYLAGGWEGLSLLRCVGWVGVLLLFVRWAGPTRRAAALHLAWLVALLALQRRMLLRPEMMTMLFLAFSLLVIDGYLETGRRWLVALLPFIHLAWVNSHQLFPVSLAVQALLVAHLLLSRWGRLGIDSTHAEVPILPVVAALAASIGLTFLTPLGVEIISVPFWTADSLSSHRTHVQEFGYIWQYPLAWRLALLCAIPAVAGLWLGRRRWRPLEVGLLLLSTALLLSAMRGIVFFSVISIAFFARTLARHPPPPRLRAAVRPAIGRLVRLTLAAVTLALVANVLYHRWVAPPLVLGGTHPGIGRTRGDWPDAAINALKRDPPPGRMMNMPWSLASPLIWFAPELPTFVDARFETFPRRFLLDAIESYAADEPLARLLELHGPGWIVAEHCARNIRRRLTTLVAQPTWVPTYLDSQILVLTRDSPGARSYIDAHRLRAFPANPRDLLPRRHGGLRAQQRACYSRILRVLGQDSEATRQAVLAHTEASADSAARARVASTLSQATNQPEAGSP